MTSPQCPCRAAWIDEDGRHIWYRHDCLRPDGSRHLFDAMLPYPAWQAKDGVVMPSIVCMVPGCGFHESPPIGEKP